MKRVTCCGLSAACCKCDSSLHSERPRSRIRLRRQASTSVRSRPELLCRIAPLPLYLMFLLLSTLCLSTSAAYASFTRSLEEESSSSSDDGEGDDAEILGSGYVMPEWKANMLMIKNMNSSQYTPRHHPAGWEDSRAKMFDQLPMSYCRFPKFYYRNMMYHDHDLDSSADSYAIEVHWKARARDKYIDGDADLKLKFDGRDPPPNPWPADRPELTRKISYLHIGEAGGTALACSLREARRYGVRRRCGKPARARFKNDDYVESAISRQVTCYSHYNYNGRCLDETQYTSFLVNLRNPIDRMKSWYLHEHFLNEPTTQPEFSKNTLHCGALMLGSCYKNFDDMASIGLLPPRDLSNRLPIRKDLTPDECAHWAWSAIEGAIPATYHNHFNYEWYLRPLLDVTHGRTQLDGKVKEIFVVRVEHLDDDWRKIDKMVGGTGETVPSDLTDGSAVFGSTSEDHLLATNATLSDAGALNLCRVLCREIQVYKMLLERAANLDVADFNQSMTELRQYCPEEPDDTPRKCEYF